MFLSKNLTVKEFEKQIEINFEKSAGSYVWCSNSNKPYLDFFQFFSSNALGYNHQIWNDPEFVANLISHSQIKISSGRVYSKIFSDFIHDWHQHTSVGVFKKYFFIHGGALAVENAFKVAFDKKRTRYNCDAKNMVVISFKGAFHGVSGFTATVTDLPESKIHDLPKFNWPKISSPFNDPNDVSGTIQRETRALEELNECVSRYGEQNIAAVLIEPIQCSSGDFSFRKEFFDNLRKFCDKYKIALIFDEIQSGFFATGKLWHFQSFEVKPDILIFGKKAQVCGLAANQEYSDGGAFEEPHRLSVTWDGHILDIVRAKYLLKYLVSKPELESVISQKGERLRKGLKSFPAIRSVRGSGLIIAFDFEDTARRDKYFNTAYAEKNMLVNVAMSKTIRIRPHLEVSNNEIDEFLSRTSDLLK